MLISYGILTKNDTILDFGCGLGDDVWYLKQLGYSARGWDPVYFPDEELSPADIVNLGYVVNVIEDPKERETTLQNAFRLSIRCLCVSALVGTASYSGVTVPCGDGLLTSKGTFQKYYRQDELANVIEDAIDSAPVPLGAGVFLAYSNVREHHNFVLSRIRRHETPNVRVFADQRRTEVRSTLISAFQEKYPKLWSSYITFVRAHGRPPKAEECKAVSKAQGYRIRQAEIYESARDEIGPNLVDEVGQSRKNDLTVFLAISRVRHLPKLSDLPPLIRADVQFHFGSYRNALIWSESQLFATGDTMKVAQLCDDSDVGVNTSDGFFFPRNLLFQIDTVLQIYVRLGELFYGDLETIDVIKIHKKSAKLSSN